MWNVWCEINNHTLHISHFTFDYFHLNIPVMPAGTANTIIGT